MWKFFHKLFGWEYVAVRFGWSTYFKRVHTTPNGERYVKWSGEPHFEHERSWRKVT